MILVDGNISMDNSYQTRILASGILEKGKQLAYILITAGRQCSLYINVFLSPTGVFN